MIEINNKINKKKHKSKKIIYFIILMLLLFIVGQKIYADTIERVTIVLQDSNLYSKLENVLNSYENVIYSPSTKTIEFPTSEIGNVKQLDLSNAGIRSLSGIEAFSGLIELNASSNSITDISNLSTLQNLKVINLSGNQQFTNVGQLKNISGLQNINLYNTGITSVEDLQYITSLKTLNIGLTSISDVSPLQSLELTELYLSGLTGIRNIYDITPIRSLKRLDLSGCTSITDMGDSNGGIYRLTNLEYLNINSTRASSSDNALIAKTYTEKIDGETITRPFLEDLVELRANDTAGISFSVLSNLKRLKILYMSNCTGSVSLSKIYEVDSLEEVYLDGNKISSIKDFVSYKTEDGVTYCDDHLAASKISLANNKIVDLSPFYEFSSNQIKYLNLSSNMIKDISPVERFDYDGRPQANLNLSNQQLTMSVRKKINTENQYMILYPIMQSAMNHDSVAYTNNNRFICSKDCYINPDSKYNVSPYFNVVIENEKLKMNPAPTLTVTLNGGVASGTTITYTISTSTSSIDSLIFPDVNLANGIAGQLKRDKKYYINALNIINLETSIETSQTLFDLKSYNISNLSGLSNFINLQTLDLSNNNFTDISELQFLTKLKVLNLSNNNIGDNNDALTYLRSLTSLSLGNTGITNLNFLGALNVATKNKMPITLLDIQSNHISDLTEVAKIPKLENLNISKNDVKDLSKISEKTTLTYLNISSNKIDDISTVGNFVNLIVFNCDNNLIEDISALSQCTKLNELSIKGNLVSNIEPLRYLTLYSFHCDNNSIRDIDPIENKAFTLQSEETPFTAYIQLIAMALDESETGDITIPLPEIFSSAKNPDSKIKADNFSVSNCTLSSDNKAVLLNVEELGDKIASVTINGGAANGTKFSIAPALKGYIAYSIEELTNKDVVATISFNRPNVTVLNNDGSTEYTFTKNGEFTFEFEDENGFTGSATAKVEWIDKEGPILSYKSEEVGTNGNILITIESNEEINTFQPLGWKRSGNKLNLTKEFSKTATEVVVVTDNVGNQSSITVSTSIDRSTLTSNKYNVDETSLFVTKISPKTTVDEFNENVNSNGTYYLSDAEGNSISGSDYITSGYKVVFNDGTNVKEYTLVVAGDLDSNGIVGVPDLAYEKSILLGLITPSELLLRAGDVNFNNEISISDLAGIQNYILSDGNYEFK